MEKHRISIFSCTHNKYKIIYHHSFNINSANYMYMAQVCGCLQLNSHIKLVKKTQFHFQPLVINMFRILYTCEEKEIYMHTPSTKLQMHAYMYTLNNV